jgi:hypothetical protein
MWRLIGFLLIQSFLSRLSTRFTRRQTAARFRPLTFRRSLPLRRSRRCHRQGLLQTQAAG